MVKGEDAVMRKKNKANRKKLHRKDSSSSAVSTRVAAIIAAKKRRKSGKRRMCEGMCFSLPTIEDPFNERYNKKDVEKKEGKENTPSKPDKAFVNGKTVAQRNKTHGRSYSKLDNQEHKNGKGINLKNELKKYLKSKDNLGHKSPVDSDRAKIQGGVNGQQGQACENSEYPSKFLILCLNSIETALRLDGTYNGEEDKPLFVDTWGIEFLKHYSVRKDILETSGACSTMEQIAWMVSTAADTIARKEKEGLSFSSPYLLFLVPSQDKAAKVRSVCKPLKALGIHTVSLHPGASLEHQIHGLKSCEPEFLVSTPERLLELISLKAIDISGVSFLVVDGLESLSRGGYLDMIKSIRQYISSDPHTVVFNDCFSSTSVAELQNILTGSVCRLSINDSVASQSAFVCQHINVCVSEEEKLSKAFQVLDQAHGNQHCGLPSKVLYIVGKDIKSHTLAASLKIKGYSFSTSSISEIPEMENSMDIDSKSRLVSLIDTANMGTTDIGEYEIVILPNFVHSIDEYVQIITRMARFTVNGVLHGFLTKEDAPLAGPLIEILKQCGQTVPGALKKLCPTPLKPER